MGWLSNSLFENLCAYLESSQSAIGRGVQPKRCNERR